MSSGRNRRETGSFADELDRALRLIPHRHVSAVLQHDPAGTGGGSYAALALRQDQFVFFAPNDSHRNIVGYLVGAGIEQVEHAVVAGVETPRVAHRLGCIVED